MPPRLAHCISPVYPHEQPIEIGGLPRELTTSPAGEATCEQEGRQSNEVRLCGYAGETRRAAMVIAVQSLMLHLLTYGG